MTHEQLVAALSRGFADIAADQQRSFEFDVTAGLFQVLDLSHKLLLIFFANGEPAEPQRTQVRLELGRFVVLDRPTGPRDMVLGDGRFAFRQTADLSPGKHIIQIENRTSDRGRFGSSSTLPSSSPIWSSMSRFFPASGCCSPRASANSTESRLVDERESLAVSDITYLFTDLKDSTPLYESVGDVNAYFLVRQHFDILNKIIRERSGTIVKTIGDAVMAGFERPKDAVLASIEMIEELSRFNQTASRPLGLKIGVHRGRAIAVRLNDRIDYFGQDVNIAARVQGLAGVNEVCLTEAVMEAPRVSDIVKGRPASRDYENLKGIGQKMEIHRIEICPTRT